MQFQNAVITPQGRAMLGAANTDKPIKFTRFLFSSSPTRLTGQETELPEPTWGDGSVDAVVAQTMLEQFVIYASATNNTDSGYACSYGIFAAQDGVERLIAVANCLGDPTHVTGSSEGYTRFHLSLTIKYAVNASAFSIEPNLAGLISRGEFEAWMNRVVTTTSPSGAPYGEVQEIYGVKTFRDAMFIGSISDRAYVLHYGDYGISGSILPTSAPDVTVDLGSSKSKWKNLYVENVYADYINNKARLVLKGNKVANQTQDVQRIDLVLDDIISMNDRFKTLSAADPSQIRVGMIFPTVRSYNSARGMVGLLDFVFYFDSTSAFVTEVMTRVTIRLIGRAMPETGTEKRYTQIYETIIGDCTVENVSDGVVSVSIGGVNKLSESDAIRCDSNLSTPQYIVVELELIR